MSKHERDGLMPCLFSRQGMSLDNIKFLRGNAPVIPIAEFRQAFCDAEARKRSGKISAVSEPPVSGTTPIDVREWVATL